MAYEQAKQVKFMNSDTNTQHDFLQLSHSVFLFKDGQSEHGTAPLYVKVLFPDLPAWISYNIAVIGRNDRLCCHLCCILSFVKWFPLSVQDKMRRVRHPINKGEHGIAGQITRGDADVPSSSNPRWECIKDQDYLPHIGTSLSSTLVLIPH